MFLVLFYFLILFFFVIVVVFFCFAHLFSKGRKRRHGVGWVGKWKGIWDDLREGKL